MEKELYHVIEKLIKKSEKMTGGISSSNITEIKPSLFTILFVWQIIVLIEIHISFLALLTIRSILLAFKKIRTDEISKVSLIF